MTIPTPDPFDGIPADPLDGVPEPVTVIALPEGETECPACARLRADLASADAEARAMRTAAFRFKGEADELRASLADRDAWRQRGFRVADFLDSTAADLRAILPADAKVSPQRLVDAAAVLRDLPTGIMDGQAPNIAEIAALEQRKADAAWLVEHVAAHPGGHDIADALRHAAVHIRLGAANEGSHVTEPPPMQVDPDGEGR